MRHTEAYIAATYGSGKKLEYHKIRFETRAEAEEYGENVLMYDESCTRYKVYDT